MCGVGRRGGVTERGMRSLDVVIPGPCRDLVTSMAHVHEQRFIEQFVAHPTVKAFHERVLGGLSRRRVVPLYLGFTAPDQHRVGGQFCAVAHWEAPIGRAVLP